MKRSYYLPLFFLLQIAVLQVLKLFPEFVERFYSNGLYLWISGFSRLLLGWIPFSFGDLLYFVLIVLAIKWLFQNRKNWKKGNRRNQVLKIIGVVSVVYFLFHLLWATNYYRVPLYQKMEIEKEYTEEELISFTKKLIIKTNEVHRKIVNNDSMKIVVPYLQNEIFEMNLNGYSELKKVHPFFSYTNPSVKKSLWSLPLTYMGFSGYLNPFTNEAQVNDKIPLYTFPFTSCHEMAHQMGYASESECNFIAFLANIKNQDLYFQYSGYVSALKYCLGTLEKMEQGKSKPYRKMIHFGILKNFKESQEFWESHQTFIDSGFEIFYDNFLKMNQQKDGMESYSKFVDLMVNYYKTRDL